MQTPLTNLHVKASHDFEYLFKCLQDVLKEPLADPLAPEVLVVPSSGLARWLTLKIARESTQQICANVHFQLPTVFIWQTCRKAMPDLVLPERSAFALDTLSLAMLEPLWDLRDGKFSCSSCTGGDLCECRRVLQHYVAGNDEAAASKMYGLGVQLAHLYEHYLTHRSRGYETDSRWNWVSLWEAGKTVGLGEGERWQQAIWQKLTAKNPKHLAWAIQQFCGNTQKIRHDRLPQRVSFFGLATLPPLYLDFLASLATHLDVHAFFFSPSMEYWGDLRKTEAKRKRLANEPFSPLALWGRRGQPLFHALIDEGWLDYAPDDYPMPEQQTLLHRLQRDILTLEEETANYALADQSLIIQHAPTPAREVEILHDALLAYFDADCTLTPDDVLVFVSDMERYAPHIAAVFSTKTPSIPYSIADLTIGNEKSLRDGFLHWIKVNDHRFAIDWILDLLHVPAFCRRFALDEGEIASIRQMVQQANMRWGYDEKQRQDLGLWPTPEHTLRHGSLRYLYGFVGIPKGHADALGVAVSPLEPGSQESADTLGKWMMMTTELKRFADALQKKRSIEAWASFLQEEMGCFFAADEEEARPLSLLLQQLYDAGKTIAFQDDIPFAIIQKWLLQHAPHEIRPGLFQGGVTFAAMLAERVFTKKIIAILGMGQEDFPRQENRLSFDLLAPQDGKRYHAMAGDPNHDEEDRYFFLQNVLAAKEALYISYVGQDPKTGEAKMPANVVNELLDWLKQKGIPEEKMVKAHPVLAYDPLYFQEDSDFFTYDASVARALEHSASANLSALPWRQRLENRNAVLPAEIRLDDLVAFFKNTSRAFLQNFGIQVPETEEVPQEREPFGNPHGLEAYTLQKQILKDQLAGLLPESSKALLRSQGLLPHGISGDEIFAQAWQSIEPLAQKIILEAPRPYAIAIDLGNCRLIGQVIVHQDRGVLAYVPKKNTSASDEVAFFLQHLALCVATKEQKVQSRLYAIEHLKGKKAACLSLKKGALDDRETLKQLIELYQRGIKQPLPFFPKSSKKFHQYRNNPKKNADAWTEAQKTWEGDEHSFGESQNPWHHYLYRDSSPVVHSSFAEIATLFWGFYDDYRG